MTSGNLLRKQKNAKHSLNVHKRGSEDLKPVNKTKSNKWPVSPAVLGVLLFVVCGSAIFQVIQMAKAKLFG